jgi:NADH-quinone oxidoreductase subunit A
MREDGESIINKPPAGKLRTARTAAKGAEVAIAAGLIGFLKLRHGLWTKALKPAATRR